MGHRARNIRHSIAFVAFGALASFWSGLAIGQPVGPVFRPETYGAVCGNTGVNNAAAFTKLTNAVNALGTGIIELARNCGTYWVHPNPVADQVVMNIGATKGLQIHFNGSVIGTTYNFAAARQIYAILLNGSTGTTITKPNFDQLNYHVRDDTRGIRGVTASGATVNTDIVGFTMTGGLAGFSCDRVVSGPRGRGVTIIGGDFSNVYYPINLKKSCDNFYATAITTIQPGRSFFVYNVSNAYAQINSDASDGLDDILIANKYNAADSTQDAYLTSNIRVDYTNRPSVAAGTGVNSYANIVFQTDGGSAEGLQQIVGVYLNMDIARSDGRGAAAMVRTENQNTTGKGRLLADVNVTGRISVSSASATAFMYLMMDRDWSFGGVNSDQVQNLNFTNLHCAYGAAAPWQMDGRAMTGPVILNGVYGNANCTWAPTNTGSGTVAYLYQSYNQVWLPGGTLVTPGATTVAGLVSCNATNEGARYRINDANATTFHSVVVGGGANHVEVYCNGTNWVIGG